MKTTFATAAVLAALIPAALGLTINTPTNVVECEPFQFTWSGGTPPYFLSLIPAQGENPIKQFPETSETSFTWIVDLQAGTNFNADIKDSTGTNAYAAAASIIAGSSTSCVNTSVNDGGSATSGGSSTAASGSSAASASTTGSSTGTASSGSASASATGSAHNGASATTLSAFSMTGVFGVVAALLF
ncbi:hypothetical protein HWV62_44556 [Athelia sp. TMB]|nr:hypothetical protein HWV62_41012 [Athelia sp. TMB]KAF7978797.1 hypothetical protein HWV62_44556 [Athelia sp. TMB]